MVFIGQLDLAKIDELIYHSQKLSYFSCIGRWLHLFDCLNLGSGVIPFCINNVAEKFDFHFLKFTFVLIEGQAGFT